MDKTQLWEFYKSKEDRTIYTITRHQINKIISVEDTGHDSDELIIENRDTRPSKGDIWEAYQILVTNKSLSIFPDLEWLKRKRISSIVFALLAQLPGVQVIKKGRITILTIKT